MSDTATPAARAWTPDPHRVAEAAIAVLDAGDALISLLDRLEGLVGSAAGRVLSESLAMRLLHAADAWRTASLQLLTTLNDDDEDILL